jgi:uncharacterized lipoprotein YddW (UPF0748 family)
MIPLLRLLSGFRHIRSRNLLAGGLLVLVLGTAHCAFARDEYRMLWVDVFHPGFRTAAEIDTMLATARAANYNAVIVQARKACDAFYNSSLEPKNEAINQSFDPLGYLVRQAHDTSGGKRPIEVHAWLVTYRCRIPGDNTWRNPKHVFQEHPGWLSQKADGSKEDKGENPGRYYLDPGVPAVVRDLLSNYDLDGIHFDYVRYPEGPGAGNQWGYNPISVARFNSLYGRNGKPAVDDPQWCDFRRRQVYFLVRKAYAHIRAWRPQVKLSAATITWGDVNRGFERSDAYGRIMQDWERMAQAGFLDIVIPMNYKRESVAAQAAAHRNWARFLGNLASESGRFGVNGVDGETLNSLEDILSQIRATRNMDGIAGIAGYCYAETRRGSKEVPDTAFFNAIRSNVFTSPARVPEAQWLTRPKEGIVKGVITSGGKPLDGATVRLGAQTALTDGSGFYAFARVAPGKHELAVETGNGARALQEIAVAAGKVAEAPVAIRGGGAR